MDNLGQMRILKTGRFFLLLILLTLLSTRATAKNFYVSPTGDDSKSGLSIKDAWKSIDKVNSVTFGPGDQILFESAGVWKGQLKPQGSGEQGKPIVLSKYGGQARPVINIGSAEGAGIRLTNQSWWDISDMEITSGAPPKQGIGRQGIVAMVEGDDRSVRHIVIRNCYVHDIWGQLGGRSEFTGYNSCAILVKKRGRHNTSSSLKDVLIENNRIERFDKAGIIVNGGESGVVVRGNTLDNLGGDGIIVMGGSRALIERNVVRRSCLRSGDPHLPGGEDWWPHTAAIWIQHTTETVMQYNEVYDTGRQPRNGDGQAYDFDFGCKRCVCQYNYSSNNHGFMLIMYEATDNIARYNISENDQTHLIQLQCNVDEGNVFYNNVFYVDYGTSDLDFFCGDDGDKEKRKLGANFHNNIFYATGQGRFRTVYTSGLAWERKFDDTIRLPKAPGTLFHHNCYFGPWLNGLPDDDEKLVTDPMFIAPGTGGDGLATLAGYKLKTSSPCINAGMRVKGAPDVDFYGNPVTDGSPDVGVYEQKQIHPARQATERPTAR